MPSWIAAAVTAPLLTYLFVRFYRYAYPTHRSTVRLQSRQEAIDTAALIVSRLMGADVTTWNSYAAVQSDDQVADKLHHLTAVAQERSFCTDWGINGSWRVRFASRELGSILVGLSARGEVVLFDTTGTIRDQVVEREKSKSARTAEELVTALSGGGQLWKGVQSTGQGSMELATGGAEQVQHFRVATDRLRIDATVHSTGSAILRLDTVTDVIAPAEQLEHLELEERREALASTAGLLGSVVALTLGVTVLGLLGARANPTLTLVLTGIVLVAAFSHELSNTQRGIVDGYDGSVPWATFRTINTTLVVIGVAVATSVVLISGMAGSAVAGEIGLALLAEPARQLVWGTWSGLAWLALAAVAFAGLKRTGLARMSETPDGRALRLGGLNLRFITGVVTQSVIAEELVYRLLVLSVVIWATGNVALAVVISAALWASMHVGSAVSPRWIRMIELFIVGVGLGVLTATVGLLAAITAHAVFNLFTLLMPVVLARPSTDPTSSPRAGSAPENAPDYGALRNGRTVSSG